MSTALSESAKWLQRLPKPKLRLWGWGQDLVFVQFDMIQVLTAELVSSWMGKANPAIYNLINPRQAQEMECDSHTHTQLSHLSTRKCTHFPKAPAAVRAVAQTTAWVKRCLKLWLDEDRLQISEQTLVRCQGAQLSPDQLDMATLSHPHPHTVTPQGNKVCSNLLIKHNNTVKKKKN